MKLNRRGHQIRDSHYSEHLQIKKKWLPQPSENLRYLKTTSRVIVNQYNATGTVSQYQSQHHNTDTES